MKVPVNLQPLLSATQREIPSLLKQLQVGQVLSAKVLAQQAPQVVKLQIATTQLLARTPIPLNTGTRLKLEVVAKNPIPELRIVRDPTPSEQRNRTVKAAVARQLPPADARKAVAELRGSESSTKQAETVRRFEAILREAGVRPEQLNSRQLQRAVTMSGIFHEARMLGGLPAQPGDMKSQLLQLLKVLTTESGRVRNPPPPAEGSATPQQRDAAGNSLLNRLIRLVEGSVSRIQLQQSAALPVEDSTRQAWQLDLPIQLPDSTDDLMLRIERDQGSAGSENAPGWSVNLAFQFDSIGTLQCRIGLNGDRVATTFWCEQAAAHNRVEQRLPILQQALEAQGLEVIHLAGVLGAPPDALIHVPMPDSLLDERA